MRLAADDAHDTEHFLDSDHEDAVEVAVDAAGQRVVDLVPQSASYRSSQPLRYASGVRAATQHGTQPSAALRVRAEGPHTHPSAIDGFAYRFPQRVPCRRHSQDCHHLPLRRRPPSWVRLAAGECCMPWRNPAPAATGWYCQLFCFRYSCGDMPVLRRI